MSLFDSKKAWIAFDFGITHEGIMLNSYVEKEKRLIFKMQNYLDMAWKTGTKLRDESMVIFASDNKLSVQGSIATQENHVSTVIELMSGNEFQTLLLQWLDVMTSMPIDVSFRVDRVNANDEVIEDDSKKNELRYMEENDAISRLIDAWRRWLDNNNNNNNDIVVMVDNTIELIECPEWRDIILPVLSSNVELLKETCQITLHNEMQFGKIIELLSVLITWADSKILFNEFESHNIDEVLMNGMIMYNENGWIVDIIWNMMIKLISESELIWNKFIDKEYNIGILLYQLYHSMQFENKKDYIVALMKIMECIFDKSCQLKYKNGREIFNQFACIYLDYLVNIVAWTNCGQVSGAFCSLLVSALKMPKIKMTSFKNDLVFAKPYNIFGIIINMIVFKMDENDFYAINEAFKILVMLISNSDLEAAMKNKFSQESGFDDLQIKMEYYLMEWKEGFYIKNDYNFNNFYNLISTIIQFIFLYDNLEKYDKECLPYLINFVPIKVSGIIEHKCDLTVYRIKYINNGTREFAVNVGRSRKNIIFPGISSNNYRDYINDSSKVFKNRNRLFKYFFEYFCDSRHLYSFSNKNKGKLYYHFGNRFHKNVSIEMNKICLLTINESIKKMLYFYFDYDRSIGNIDRISNHFLSNRENFRNVIKERNAMVDALIGNSTLCWAQCAPLFDKFGMLQCAKAKENDEILIIIFTMLAQKDIENCKIICQKWNKLTDELMQDCM